MSNVININPSNDIAYHMCDEKIDAVSLTEHDKYKLYIGMPDKDDEEKTCSVFLEGGYHNFSTEELKSLLISWLCLVDPDVIKADE